MNYFWRKVKKTKECWLWTGAISKGGYGLATFRGRQSTAHRIAYQIANDIILDNPRMHVDHLCRNRPCVNPAHLELVTARENYLRGYGWSGKNARKTHCPQGHGYTSENTINEGNGRKCRICHLERVRKKGREVYWSDPEKGRRISREKRKKARDRKNAQSIG
jgi:hypothetical protein